jgi:hypothetical protein
MLDRWEIKIITAEDQFDAALLRLKNRPNWEQDPSTLEYKVAYANLALALRDLKIQTIAERDDNNITPEHAAVIAKSADDLVSSIIYYLGRLHMPKKSFVEAMNDTINEFTANINPIPKNLRRLRMAFWILAGAAIGSICALTFLGVGVLGSLVTSIVIWKKSEAAALIGAAFTTFAGTLLGYRYSLSNPDNSTAEKVIYTLAGLAIGLAIGQLLIGAMLWYELAINIVDSLMKANTLALVGAAAIWGTCTFFGGAVGKIRNQNPNEPIDTAGKKVADEVRKLTHGRIIKQGMSEHTQRANKQFYRTR